MRTYLRILSYGESKLLLGIPAGIGYLIHSLAGAMSLVSVIPFLEILLGNLDPPAPTEPFALFNVDLLKSYGYYQLGQAIQELGKMTVLYYYCAFLIGAIIIKNLARVSSTYLFGKIEFSVVKNLRAELFERLTMLGLPFYTRKKKGEIISTMVGDMQVVRDSVVNTLMGLVRDPIMMITFFVSLLIISWKLTLFTLIILPLTGLVINAIRKPLQRRTHISQELLGNLVAILDEFISGIRIVKAFRREDYERRRFANRNEHQTRTELSIHLRHEMISPITEVMSVAVICVVIIYGSSMIFSDNSDLTGPEFLAFVGLFSQFLAPMKSISNAITRIQKGLAAYSRVDELIKSRPEVVDTDKPVAMNSFERELRFDKVCFRYERDDVLRDVSFELEKGKTLALVGPSGAGKSTLVDLIPRFFDPYKGKILLDGTDIRDLSLHDLRGLISIVTQEGILFHDTILNNIAYGIENPNREAVIEAAKIANAHEFIMQIPEGYDSIIGERGTMLSGGQRQRLSIARAVLSQAPILLLDEATSNLDTRSEKLVQEALENLMKGRTAIIIAHRLSTVQHADMILTLDEGQITERGTHRELMEAKGLYAKLHSMQFSV